MYSPATIADMERRASRDAARRHKAPHLIFSADTAVEDWRGAPFVGSYCSPAWRPVKVDEIGHTDSAATIRQYAWDPERDGILRFEADASGFGTDGELALSLRQQAIVALALHSWGVENQRTVGVAIVEAGQFQVVLGVYVRKTAAEKG